MKNMGLCLNISEKTIRLGTTALCSYDTCIGYFHRGPLGYGSRTSKVAFSNGFVTKFVSNKTV